jgi:hypothetical protein
MVKHSLFDLIFIAISACVSGVDDWQTIALWAKTQKGGFESTADWRTHSVLVDVPPGIQDSRLRSLAEGVHQVDARHLESNSGGKGVIHVVSAWLSANLTVLRLAQS